MHFTKKGPPTNSQHPTPTNSQANSQSIGNSNENQSPRVCTNFWVSDLNLEHTWRSCAGVKHDRTSARDDARLTRTSSRCGFLTPNALHHPKASNPPTALQLQLCVFQPLHGFPSFVHGLLEIQHFLDTFCTCCACRAERINDHHTKSTL